VSAKKMRRGHRGKRPSKDAGRAKAKKLLVLDDSILELERFDDDEQDVKDRIHQMVQERTEFDPATNCQIFTGAWEENGQAKMRVGARVYCLSRIVAWLYHPGFQLWGLNRAVRKCDNPACCNGEHVVVVADQAEAMSALRRNGKV
jgi:uncharacterized protein YfkK (UPF0435 family)